MADAPTLGELERESVHDTMRAVLAETSPSPDGAVAEALSGGTEEPTVEEKSTVEATTETEAETAARERDEKGRFVAKDKPEGEGAAPIAAVAETSSTPALIDEEPLEPLPDWPADKHDTFRKLPRGDQQFVLDTIKAAQDKAAEISKVGGKFAEFEEILAPRREALARDGLTEAGYVRQLVALSDFAGRDPAGFVRWFTQQRQINPAEVWPQEEVPIDGADDDPVYQRLSSQNLQLQQKLDNLERTFQNQQWTVETQSLQRIASEIEGFGKAADDKGRLQHPYFDQVRKRMGAELKNGFAADLQSAYDMACRADPDVSAKIASAQRAQEERERAKQQRVKAEAARQAGSSVSGTPGDRASPEPTGDIREDMRRQFVERGIALS